MANTNRIMWSESSRSTEQGTVGGVDLFAIGMNTNRSGKRWLLVGKLPGFARDLGQFDTTDEAKVEAEAVLVAFVRQLGARF